MKIRIKKPSNETPCSICGGKKELAEVEVSRYADNPLGTNRLYDCWRCRTCGYPIYVYHRKSGGKNGKL